MNGWTKGVWGDYNNHVSNHSMDYSYGYDLLHVVDTNAMVIGI